jgi:hypothetical protein
MHENVFVADNDGTLRVDYFNGAKWNWLNLGKPGVAINSQSAPAVINYPAAGGALFENVFVTGTDGKLYCDHWTGTKWTWVGLGNAGVAVEGHPAVINYQAAGALFENVFVIGANGRMYNDFWNGARWTWLTMGEPAGGVQLASAPAAINYGAAENVFVTGNNGRLYDDFWNGTRWTWLTMGEPAGGVPLATAPAAINYGAAENVFVTGNNGRLYDDFWNGARWTWLTMGEPAGGVPLATAPAVVNYQVAERPTYENVFVTGNNGRLYDDFWNGARWTWLTMGEPAGGLQLATGPGVINYQGAGGPYENVFVTVNNGQFYDDFWNGYKWTWVDLHAPP